MPLPTAPGRDGDGAGLQGQIRKQEKGIFHNPDAIDAKLKKHLAKQLESVLKVATEKSIIPGLMVNNPLSPEMGTEGKFYDWGQLVAVKKADGAPTYIQKVKPGVSRYELEEYEVKVGITDRSRINSQMGAQAQLDAGKAGVAFARAMDSDGFNAMLSDISATTVSTNWNSITDDAVFTDISDERVTILDAGFEPNTIILTELAMNRLRQVAFGAFATPVTAERLLKEHLGFSNVLIWRLLTHQDENGDTIIDFDPTVDDHTIAIFDKDALGVFTERPTTMEVARDAFAGIDFAIMRKYFKTAIIQTLAGRLINGIFQ